MRNVRQLLATTLLALLALTALAVSSATAAPEALKFAGNVGEGTGGEGELTTLGGGISTTCKKETLLKVEFLTATTGRIADIHFEGCTSLGAFKSNSLGDESGVILTGELTFKLCTANTSPLEVGIELALAKEQHIEVPLAGALINLKGTISGILTPISKLTKTFAVTLTKSGAGDQSAGKCVSTLLSSKDEKHVTFASAAITGTATLTFPKEFEVMG